jgi:chemotaxis protein methyltransferase CheR
LISFCKIRHIPGFTQCLSQVRNDSILKQELINYLTTNESFFYREFHQIHDLVKKVTQFTHQIDILCAPCSTGEELYSIVIALLDAGVPKTRFNITGIDINTEALSHAKCAIYNQRNISNLPVSILNQYFIKEGLKYRLNNRVKDCVKLKTENVFSSSFKTMGSFDFIFSRNMLIYFDMETKIKAKNILEGLLKDRNTPVYFGHADLF